jgi:hypothetical protein
MLGAVLLALGMDTPASSTQIFRFRGEEIRSDFGVGYAVRIGDVNGNGRPDIIAINPSQLVWFENPDWREHVILDGQTPRDNVTIAPHDITGDGQLDIAIGSGWNPRNTKSGGALHWTGRSARGAAAGWDLTSIGEEPTLHRIRWADVDGTGQPKLIVAPLHGRGTEPPEWEGAGARVLVYQVPPNPRSDPWPMEVADDSLRILHNFLVTDFDGDGREEIVTASREGIHVLKRQADGWTRVRIAEGAPGEISLGRVGGRRALATIEPWHGHSVVVHVEHDGGWRRQVIEEHLDGGHALAWADLNGDDDDELVVGWRGENPGVALYKLHPDGQLAVKQLIDDGGMATEDLVVADLDGNGRPDIVAVGRATSNVKIYWNGTAILTR